MVRASRSNDLRRIGRLPTKVAKTRPVALTVVVLVTRNFHFGALAADSRDVRRKARRLGRRQSEQQWRRPDRDRRRPGRGRQQFDSKGTCGNVPPPRPAPPPPPVLLVPERTPTERTKQPAPVMPVPEPAARRAICRDAGAGDETSDEYISTVTLPGPAFAGPNISSADCSPPR